MGASLLGHESAGSARDPSLDGNALADDQAKTEAILQLAYAREEKTA